MKTKKITWRETWYTEGDSPTIRIIYPSGSLLYEIRKPVEGRSGVYRVYRIEESSRVEIGMYHYLKQAKEAIRFLLSLE